MNNLKGIIPAVVTPLQSDGELDIVGVQSLINKIMDAGCNGVMILGTIGEGVDLPRKVAYEMMEKSVEIMAGRGMVVAGVAAADYTTNVKNIHAAKKAGVNAVLQLPPFFHKFSQDMLYDYFISLAEESDVPMMLYNMPEVSKVTIEFDTIKKLSQHKNIVGMKDSSGDMEYFEKVSKEVMGEDFALFIGRTPFSINAYSLGASGIMSPSGNLLPELELKLKNCVANGDMETAKKIAALLTTYAKICNDGALPISVNVKALLSKAGVCQKYTAPGLPVHEEDKVNSLYEEFEKILNAEI